MYAPQPIPFASASINDRRVRIEMLCAQLRQVRTSFEPHWKECAQFTRPRTGRWWVQDTNRGDSRNGNIIDSTATFAIGTLSSGLMAGVTSPARPWFRLTTPDPEMAEQADTKEWLHTVTSRMQTVFLRSNLYQILPTAYTSLGIFGLAGAFLEEDDETVIRLTHLPVGSFWIGNDKKGRVRVYARHFTMTVRQVVEKWCQDPENPSILKLEKLSQSTRNLWDSNSLETPVEIQHVVYPNPLFDGVKKTAKHKPFAEVYFEPGATPDGTRSFLAESGYDEFPGLFPRWDVEGEDAYATSCPAMVALGDIKQLQTGERRGLQAIEKKVNPPIQAPTSLKTARPSILPGEITYHDERDAKSGMRAIHEVNLGIEELEMKQDQIRFRIRRAFFEDLFLMLANTNRRQITAREIDERHEEKLLALGPMLERLNQDLLDPLIDRTFNIMLRRGLIPPPPESLQGVDLKVEYISMMQAAQKMVGIGGLERITGYVITLAQAKPDVIDKFDFDQAIDEYAEMSGVSPRVIVPDDEVAEIRAGRAEMQMAQANQEMAMNRAKEVEALAKAKLDQPSALTQQLGLNGSPADPSQELQPQ